MEALTKKVSILLLTFTLTLNSAQAQDEYVKGYVVNLLGDTLFGALKDRKVSSGSSERLKKILFINAEGKKTKFEHKEIAAYKIGNDIYRGFYLANLRSSVLGTTHYSIDPFNGSYSFLKLIIDDRIKLYQYEWYEQGENGMDSFGLIQRGREDLFIRADQGLLGLKKKQLLSYFDECPILQEKIKQDAFSDAAELVGYYNNTCFYVALE